MIDKTKHPDLRMTENRINTQGEMSDNNENSYRDSPKFDAVHQKDTLFAPVETEELRKTDSRPKSSSSSFRPIKALLGLGVFAVLTGNILLLTNHLKSSSSITGMEGMDHGNMSHDEMMTVDGSFNPHPVEIEIVKPEILEATVSYTGTIKPYEEITVYPRVAGQLTNYSVYPGDRITAGQPIAILDASELTMKVAEVTAEVQRIETDIEISKIEVEEQKSAIAQIEADLNYLNLKKQRFATLVEEGVIAQDEFDVADSEVKSKEASLRQAQVKLARLEAQVRSDQAKLAQSEANLDTAKVMEGYTVITSPISGIIQERNVDPGVVVQPSMGIVTIGNYNQVRLQANVAQQDAVNIRLGATVIAIIPDSNIAPIKGKITSIFPQANSQTRTVTVEAIIDNPEEQLLSGKFIEMKIITVRQPNAITIPQEAVVEFQGQPSVWVVEGNTVTSKFITLGMLTGNRIEVTSGLDPGQVVVISGQSRLVENTSVTVINESEESRATQESAPQDVEIRLVSPNLENGVPMGDTQLIVEIKDSQGQPLDIKDLEISASMPMKNMAPMSAPVEVQSDDSSGKFKAETYLNMRGDWIITVTIKDPNHKSQQDFNIKVK